MQTDPFYNRHDPGPRRTCLRCAALSDARQCDRCQLPTAATDGSADPWTGVIVGGSYRLTGPLGAGGMGLIYRAQHIRSGKSAAVKVLLAQSADHDTRERFAREAANLGSVEHPNVVQIFDCELRCTEPFMAMELLQGESLYALIKREKCLSVPRAAHIACQVLAGLGAVHKQGIVHRDLKPENLMVVRAEGHSDFIKIIDFGIGRAEFDGTLTGAGKAIGTPAYMSPEQFGEGELGPRSDLYALGVVLYQILTGRWPFDARDGPQFMWAHMHIAPHPLRKFRPDADARLEAVLAKAMAKRAQDRYADADAMRRALLPFCDAHAGPTGPIDTPPQPQDGRRGTVTEGIGPSVDISEGGWPPPLPANLPGPGEKSPTSRADGGRTLPYIDVADQVSDVPATGRASSWRIWAMGAVALLLGCIAAATTACQWLPAGATGAVPWCDACARASELAAYQPEWCACRSKAGPLAALDAHGCATGKAPQPGAAGFCAALPDHASCGCFAQPGSAQWCGGCPAGLAKAAVGTAPWCACRKLAGPLSQADVCACQQGKAVSKGDNDAWCGCFPNDAACACRQPPGSQGWCQNCPARRGEAQYSAADCLCRKTEGEASAETVCACETLRTAKEGGREWCACKPLDARCKKGRDCGEPGTARWCACHPGDPGCCGPVGSPKWCRCHAGDPLCGI